MYMCVLCEHDASEAARTGNYIPNWETISIPSSVVRHGFSFIVQVGTVETGVNGCRNGITSGHITGWWQCDSWPPNSRVTHPRDHLQRGPAFCFLHGAYLVSNRSELRWLNSLNEMTCRREKWKGTRGEHCFVGNCWSHAWTYQCRRMPSILCFKSRYVTFTIPYFYILYLPKSHVVFANTFLLKFPSILLTRAPHTQTSGSNHQTNISLATPMPASIRYCRHINDICKNYMKGNQIFQKSWAISTFYAPQARHEASYTLRTHKY